MKRQSKPLFTIVDGEIKEPSSQKWKARDYLGMLADLAIVVAVVLVSSFSLFFIANSYNPVG